MKHDPIRLGVTTCDAIIANGELHAITKVTPLFVEIKYLRGDREPISLTHAELAELINGGQFSIQYGYFESRQVARRAIAGRSLMTRLSTKAQLDAFWKECWATTYLEMEAESTVIPKLRGHVERVFLTLAKRLMPHLTGRTFSNPKERGDYQSHKYAVHTAESIIELLVRFTVDVYHNRKHSGLEYATPNIVWDRLIKEFGWSPPMSNHTLRHILGVAFSRDTGRHGVLVNGVNYHSERLAKHFQKFGKQHADVRIDPEDMGHISVWLENGPDSGWSTLKAQIDGLDDVSFAAWEQTIFNLRQNNRNAASLTQGVVDRAIERIKEIDVEQCALRQLGPIGETYEQIKRAQKETFWGLSLGSDPQLDPKPLDDRDRSSQGLLSNEIEQDPKPQPEEQSVLPEEQDEPIPYWPSSDDHGEPVNDDNPANQESDDDNNE